MQFEFLVCFLVAIKLGFEFHLSIACLCCCLFMLFVVVVVVVASDRLFMQKLVCFCRRRRLGGNKSSGLSLLLRLFAPTATTTTTMIIIIIAIMQFNARIKCVCHCQWHFVASIKINSSMKCSFVSSINHRIAETKLARRFCVSLKSSLMFVLFKNNSSKIIPNLVA